ncbi:MAG: hypothetical protein FJX74_24500, partial [Armatimonadetes bacterium]|nr:hypothetical protein [Armatimonadota bacterium]
GKGTFRGANVISGNGSYGILVQGPLATGNLILGNLIGVDPLGNASLDAAKRNKLANGKSGVAILDRAHHNQIKGGNVISGNGGFGVIISGLGTDANLVDGNVIGLNRAQSVLVPNGQATLYDTGVCVRAELGQYGPADTAITNNRIYGEYRCVWLADLTFNRPIGQLNYGNRVVGNRLGFSNRQVPAPRGIGVFVAECHAYLGDNEIAGRQIGVQALGLHAYIGVKECLFFDNSRHVQFAQHSAGCLGRDGAPEASWRYGRNQFGDSSSYAVDAYEAHSNQVLYAQNCNWGVYNDPGIEARIRFRQNDTQHTDVVYNPALFPGPSAPAATTVAVTGLTAQPTGRGAAITFSLSAEAAVSVHVTNIAGRPVKCLAADRPCSAGTNALPWDGRSDGGTHVPSGAYLIRVIARSADGAQSQSVASLALGR